MKKEDIDDFITKEINSNSLVKVNGIYLKRWYIDILERYNIHNYGSLSELIMIVEEMLEESDDEELEQLSTDLSEMNYYENTNK